MLEQKVPTFNDLLFIPFEYGKMDCWILAREVFKRYGVDVPDYNPARQAVMLTNYEFGCISQEMEKELVNWDLIDSPEVPCLVVYESAGISPHVGVCIGNGKFIHTARRLVYPAIERLDNPRYATKKYYRFNPNHGD